MCEPKHNKSDSNKGFTPFESLINYFKINFFSLLNSSFIALCAALILSQLSYLPILSLNYVTKWDINLGGTVMGTFPLKLLN